MAAVAAAAVATAAATAFAAAAAVAAAAAEEEEEEGALTWRVLRVLLPHVPVAPELRAPPAHEVSESSASGRAAEEGVCGALRSKYSSGDSKISKYLSSPQDNMSAQGPAAAVARWSVAGAGAVRTTICIRCWTSMSFGARAPGSGSIDLHAANGD